MKKIPLPDGLCTLVDNEDYPRVKKYTWFTSKGKYGPSCVRTSKKTHGIQKTLLLHRVIMNAKHEEVVDHINHNALDNRKMNLRTCSRSENSRNMKLRIHSSRFKGVSWHERANKWVAYIWLFGKGTKYLGLFSNEIEAGKAYNCAALKYFGEFGYLNPV